MKKIILTIHLCDILFLEQSAGDLDIAEVLMKFI